jgi:3-hydroxyisobutyrate dehydrogenase-like beta-hydroxyacid dehydrogenase
VQGFDVSPVAIAAAQSDGIDAAPDIPSLLLPGSITLVCVFDDGQLIDVVGQIAAARLSSAGGPDVVINVATCSPDAVESAAVTLRAQSIAFMELPLSGSSVQILEGEALGLLGADDATLARHADVIHVLSPRHFHVGPPGAGARAKLASNLVLGLNRAALAEGIVLARRLGLDGSRFLELLRLSPAYSRAVDTVGERMVAHDFAPRSRLAQHRKDLGVILQVAGGDGAGLPLAQAHLELLDRAIALGYGDQDNAAVIAALTVTGPASPSVS